MTEIDVIGHLLDVEQQAAEMLLEAQTEADRRISEARNQADADYKVQYEKIVAEFEKDFAVNVKEVEDSHSDIMAKYRETIESTQTDKASFTSLLDKLLFAD